MATPKMTDGFGRSDLDRLDRATMIRALEALRYRASFHTHDLSTHSILRTKHRMAAFDPGFRELVERWLNRNGFSVGLRGPLPGHPAWGARWAFFEGEAALTPAAQGEPKPEPER